MDFHGTKSDKETQSPLLKVFKDIMTREKNDPEKRNLLPYQNDEKKRKHYSGNRTKKIDRKSSELSKLDNQQRNNNAYQQYSEQRHEFPQTVEPEAYPATETKDSGWWNFTKEIKSQVCDMTYKKGNQSRQDDTCSCTSCALKRILTDYCGIACLSILFAISVIAVFCFICTNFKSEATTTEGLPQKELPTADPLEFIAKGGREADSERMKRRIEALERNGEVARLVKDDEILGKPHYDSIRSDPMDLSGSPDIDLRSSLHELDGFQGYSELPSLMNPTEINMQSSDKLREFYKKLVQTDAKIKTLKKLTSNENENFIDNLQFEMNAPDRTKRSLKIFNYPKRFKIRRFRIDREAKDRPNKEKDKINKNQRLKRSSNDSDDATGFVIEKKKIIFQFKPKPGRKLVAKCSHMPKDSHSHEHQLKHPFYQNSGRLDQILDNIFNKNLPDVRDPFGFEDLFENVKKCKHLKPYKNINTEKSNKEMAKDNFEHDNKYTTVKPVNRKGDKHLGIDSLENNNENILNHEAITILKPEEPADNNDLPINDENKAKPDKMETTSYENGLLDKVVDMIDKEEQAYVTVSPTGYDILLSISTVINPYAVSSPYTNVLVDKIPNLRRLMQAEEEDSIAYEDFKEVLTDNMENQDDMEKRRDRKKRDDNLGDSPTEVKPVESNVKYTPESVNPNWKGPMPLYPDEIGSMMNKADDVNKLTSTLESNMIPTQIPQLKNTYENVKSTEDPNIKAAQSVLKAAQDLNDKIKAAQTISRLEREVSEDEYAENDEDIDNFVEMAQAYSDYGVLEEKKYSKNEKNPATDILPYLRLHLSGNGEKYLKRGILSKKNHAGIFSLFPKKEKSHQKTSEINTNDDPNVQSKKITKIFSLITPKDKNMKLKNVVISTVISTLPNSYAKDIDKNVDSKFDTSNKMKVLEHENDVTETNIYKNIAWPNIDAKNKRKIDKNGELSNVEANNAPSVNIAKDPIIGNSQLLNYVSKVTQSNFDMFNASQTDYDNSQDEKELAFMNNVTTLANKINKEPSSFENESEDNLDGTEYDSQTYLGLDNAEIGIDAIERQFDVPFVVNFNENDETNSLFEDEIRIKNGGYDIEEITTGIPKSYEAKVRKAEIINSSLETIGTKKRVKRDVGTETKLLSIKRTKDTSDFINFTIKNGTELYGMKNIIWNYTNNNNMTLSGFLMMMSDWFKTLEGVNVDSKKNEGNRSSSDITKFLLLLNNGVNETKPNVTTSTTERVYPLYDSDMIENIGHRSRVLLSIKDDNETDIKENIRNKNESKVDVTKTKNDNIKAAEPIKAATNPNITNNLHNIANINNTTPNATKDIEANNKKVKRNADDSNLIFWTDMYDDEYGIQTDHLDSVKDKDRKENHFMKRSEKWVQDKIKKFSNNFKVFDTMELDRKSRMPREAKSIGIIDYPKYYYSKVYDKFKKREIENENKRDQQSMFDSLNANMLRVCRNAAEAVKKTRNTEAQSSNKESKAASSMMQQLVRLLTDLVDYQVEQNTCAKLPPDLQSFLEWLTESEDSKQEQHPSFRFTSFLNREDPHHSSQFDITNPNTENRNGDAADKIDTEAHLLETVKSIQDLLDDYGEMNEEDKMKVTGVKFYLENQLRHLNKNFVVRDEFNPFNKHRNNIEFNIPTLRKRRSLNKWIKKITKKHTKTTPDLNNAKHSTEELKNNKNKALKTKERNKKIKHTVSKDKTRNLKDVYYAKPITIAKEDNMGVLDSSENAIKKDQNLPVSKLEKDKQGEKTYRMCSVATNLH